MGCRVREIEKVSKDNVEKFDCEGKGKEWELRQKERSTEDSILLPLFFFLNNNVFLKKFKVHGKIETKIQMFPLYPLFL